jgi:hypothetical protein
MGDGETFSKAEQTYLISLNSDHEITTEDQGWEFEVTTPKQHKIESEEIFLDPLAIGKHLIVDIPQLGEQGREITVTYCGWVDDRVALDRLNYGAEDAIACPAYYVRDSEDLYVFVIPVGEDKPRWIKPGEGK